MWPQIKSWFGDGDLIPVEAVTNVEMAKLLDTCAGIDAWYVETNKGIRGIGSRVQWGVNYKTFTIRKEKFNGWRTEYEKLCDAIENDWLYPYWFCQAYLTEKKGRLCSVAVVETKKLINYIKTYDPIYISNKTDAWFWVINWSKIGKVDPILIKDNESLEAFFNA